MYAATSAEGGGDYGCRRAAGGGGGGEAACTPEKSGKHTKTIEDEEKRMRLWEQTNTKIKKNNHHCVLLVCAHGLTKDTGRVTRSCDPAYKADVEVYSIVGGSFEPGTEQILKGKSFSNYFVMPTVAWSVFNKNSENRKHLNPMSPRTSQKTRIRMMVEEFGDKIVRFNAEAHIKYETHPVWEENPSLTREFYMLPNRNEIVRDGGAGPGEREQLQRECADYRFLKEHGMLLIFTTNQDPNHKNLSLAELSPANLRGHPIGEFVGEPFITPKNIEQNNIFGWRNHKHFQEILVANGVDETDTEGAIQILRRGVKKKIITLEELSILIYCLGYTSFTLLDGSCRTLREHFPQARDYIDSLGTNASQDQEPPVPPVPAIDDIKEEEDPDEDPADKELGGKTNIIDILKSLVMTLAHVGGIVRTTTETMLNPGWWKDQIQSWRSKPKQGGSINSSRKSSRTHKRTHTRTRTHTRRRTHTRTRTRTHTRKHKKRYTKRRYIGQ
jgi:hypothetical protein